MLAMNRVFAVNYSSDATYVLSGSDDTNIRLWKAKASEQLGVVCNGFQGSFHVNSMLS